MFHGDHVRWSVVNDVRVHEVEDVNYESARCTLFAYF